MIPRVLTIAGSDSGGGAGIQADLKTFASHHVYGMSVLTAITAQNTQTVSGVADLPPDIIVKQFEAVLSDIGVDAAKTGMLSAPETAETVAAMLEKAPIEKLVIDPVMVSSTGYSLLHPKAEEVLRKRLLPLAFLITPNLLEAEKLAGMAISNESDMEKAARALKGMGPKRVLIKGGHAKIPGKEAVDILLDGNDFFLFKAPWFETKNTHGTGCTLSAGIAAGLGKGLPAKEAVARAKEYVTGAIRNGFALGKGNGPLNHFWETETRP